LSDDAFMVRPMQAEDADACRELIAGCFPEEAARNARALADLEQEPWYAPSDRLVGTVADRIVAHLAMRTGDLWIAGHPFPAGLIGSLAVCPDSRGRGHATRLVEAACAELRRRGAAVAVVGAPGGPVRSSVGQPDGGFFERLGFRPGSGTRPSWRLDLALTRPGPFAFAREAFGPLHLRPGVPDDWAELDALYFQHYSRLTGGWSRSREFWSRRLAGEVRLWTGPAPEILLAYRQEHRAAIAYLAVSKEENCWTVAEAASIAGHERAIAAAIGGLCEDAAAHGVRVFTVEACGYDPLVRHLGEVGFQWRPEPGATLVRALDGEGVVRRAREILSLRAMEEKTDALVEVSGDAFEVGARRQPGPAPPPGRPGGLVTVRLGPDELAVLLHDGAALERFLGQGKVRVEPSGPPDLARAKKLFPETYAMRSRLDAY